MSVTSAGPRGYLPPGFLQQHVVNPIARTIGVPTLIVRGRISGREISTPVAPFEFEGDTYVIAGRGETQWVRNLRVAGRCEVRVRWHRQPHLAPELRVAGRCEVRVRWHRQPHLATELRGAEHQFVVTAYIERLGRRADFFLAELPDPADHPIFRLEPTGPPRRGPAHPGPAHDPFGQVD